ncbi:hypothetical protein ACIQU2_27430 [Pseudomonas sp. NPDC098740]|uniref:hypothetical protein n=1 Tax=Pseudomonas sp. NPDC098740 TaxID=3364486 RepID=UPI00383ADE64
MAFSYVGPAVLTFAQVDGAEAEAAVSVTLGETLPGLFELSFPYALPASLDAVRVILPGGQGLGGEVRYLGASSLTFWSADRPGSP